MMSKQILKLNYILFTLLFSLLLVFCNNTSKHFGEAAFQLAGSKLELDLETYFQDENLFRNYHDSNLDASFKSEDIFFEIEYKNEDEVKDSVYYFTHISQFSKSGDRPELKFEDFEFSHFGVVSSVDYKNILIIYGQDSHYEYQQIKDLIQTINKKYSSQAELDLHQLESSFGAIVFYWDLGDQVLLLNSGISSRNFELEEDDGEYEYEGGYYPGIYEESEEAEEDIEKTRPLTKEIQNQIDEIAEGYEELKVSLFLCDKEFLETYREFARFSSGALTNI